MNNEEIDELVESLESYEKSAPSAIELEKMTQAINELNDLLPNLTNDTDKVRQGLVAVSHSWGVRESRHPNEFHTATSQCAHGVGSIRFISHTKAM